MANIRNSISMVDHMTPTLRAIMKAMDSTLKAMDQMNRAANNGMQSKAFKQAEKDIQSANNALIKMKNYTDMTRVSAAGLKDPFDRTKQSVDSLLKSVNSLKSGSGSLGSVIASGARVGISALKDLATGYNATRVASSLSSKLMSANSTMYANSRSHLANVRNTNPLTGGGNAVGNLLKGVGWGALGAATSMLAVPASQALTAFTALGTTIGNVAAKGAQSMGQLFQSVAAGIYTVKNLIAAFSNLMTVADSAKSAVARLELFNTSEHTGEELYNQIYSVANDTGTDVGDTANLVNRILMSEALGTGEDAPEAAIGMAGIINKALVAGGGTGEENQRAIRQLTQGLSSGVLQGDELRSIREQAPYLAKVLAQGLGKVDEQFEGIGIGDLKALGAEGKLTADVVLQAFAAMETEVDAAFEQMPTTFGRVSEVLGNIWSQFLFVLARTDDPLTPFDETGPLTRLLELFEEFSEYLRSEEGIEMMEQLGGAFNAVAIVIEGVTSLIGSLFTTIAQNAEMVKAIFLTLGIIALIVGIMMLISFIMANLGAILLIIVIFAIIYALMQLGVSAAEIMGAICGVVAVAGAFVANIFIQAINTAIDIFGVLWNFIATFVNFFANVFKDPLAAVARLFVGLVDGILGILQTLAGAIDFIFGTKLADGVQGWRDDLGGWVDDTFGKGDEVMAEFNSRSAHIEQVSYDDAWDAGYNLGYDAGNALEGFDMSALTGDGDLLGGDVAGLLEDGIGIDGGNLDSIGSIDNDVDISDEDLKLLRDMAARDYLLQLQTITPVANVTFGDVRETADVGKIVEAIEQMVDEQMATSLVS